MAVVPGCQVRRGRMVPRRAWLAGALLAWVGPPTLGQEPGPSAVDEEQERAEVEALGKQAGLRPFRIGRSPRFLALGDARDDFRSLTLRDCEAVADDYLAHYRAKGFEVRPPSSRLTIVTLADDRSFAAYLKDKSYLLVPGRQPRPSVQGLYQRSTNRFVTYDHRSLGPQLAPR